MPRKPATQKTKFIHPGVGVNAIRHALRPLSNYEMCESPAFVRRALRHAISKDIEGVSRHANLVPNPPQLLLGAEHRRSKDVFKAIESKKHIEQAAMEAATQIKKARLFFEKAEEVGEEIAPILYYYGGVYFLDFICLNLLRRERRGSPGHGLSMSSDSNGWDFDKNWAREKCRIRVEGTGDFAFYVDALTVSGWASLFSGFRLHKDLATDPWSVVENPAPLFSRKTSLDMICNFDMSRFLNENPKVEDWLQAIPRGMVWKVTSLLMDLVVVYAAASLARYCTPAWTQIIEANKDDIYNDIRTAYLGLSEGFPLFFEDEYPFQYSYGTKIPSF